MAKAESPEEFFEVLRSARRGKKRPADRADAPSAAPAPATTGQTPAPATPTAQKPQPERPAAEPERQTPRIVVSHPSTERQAPRTVASPASAQPHRSPLSVFAEDEPTITFRRSTVAFIVVGLIVLLFIFYALGKRSGRAASPKVARPAKTVVERGGLVETRSPIQPERFQGKCAVYLKVLDHTQPASEANARACRDFLSTSSDAAFIRQADKEAFILSYDQRLFVCVGPFDTLDGPDIDAVLVKLRALRYNGVPKFFEHAASQRLPAEAKLFL